MKYICLGCFDKGEHEGATEGERQAMFDTCFEYDDHFAPTGIGLVEKRSASGNRPDPVLEERQSRNYGWSLCGNQGPTRRHSRP